RSAALHRARLLRGAHAQSDRRAAEGAAGHGQIPDPARHEQAPAGVERIMSGHSPHHDELLPAYALGALDGEDLHELETHLASGCADCRGQLALWQGDLEELAA